LMFMIRRGKYQRLLWQYTRAIFYVSQLLLTKVDDKDDLTDAHVHLKKNIYDEAAGKLELILVLIDELEEKIRMEQVMKVDTFLDSTLLKSGLTESNIDAMKEGMEEHMKKKGINNKIVSTLVGTVTDQLKKLEVSPGNLMHSLHSIAQNIADDLRNSGDPACNKEGLSDTLTVLKGLMFDMINDNDSTIPANIKDMVKGLIDTSPILSSETATMEEINEELEKLITTHGLDSREFMESITDESTNSIDPTKLENYLERISEASSTVER